MTDQPAPDFEEARQVSAEIIAGQRMTMTGPRWMTMHEQKLLAETVDALLSEREAHEEVRQWTCIHGVTYSGSDDFISGARNCHHELDQIDQRLAEAEAILSKAQAPVRADGTYNFSREAFEQMANDYFATLPATESAQPEQPTSEAGS